MKLLFIMVIVCLTITACSATLPQNISSSSESPSSATGMSQDTIQPHVTQTSGQSKTLTPTRTESNLPEPSIATSTSAEVTTLQAPNLTPTVVPFSSVGTGNAIIADHTVIDAFDSIPPDALAGASALKVLFMHQSTGNNIDFLGMKCLAGLQGDPSVYPNECITYSQKPYDPYDIRNWEWKEWDEPMADAIAKADQWVAVVNSQHENYQVLGMKFCYVDGWNQDFANYRDRMLELETKYPEKIFIWSTSALWQEPGSACEDNGFNSCQNIAEFNRQVRDYATANQKPLYDLADIESHDPDGNLCLVAGYEGLCDQYYNDYGGGGGGHPDIDGSIRLAKGFWWLIARISGWNGN